MSMNESAFAAARRHMVQSQLLPNKITDAAVIAAMGAVPRELFVPAERRGVAYLDEDIEIARGRYLMEPMVLARALQALEILASDRAMEIGSATGYGAAVMARMAASVVAVEEDPALAGTASANLEKCGTTNASVSAGRLGAGAVAKGPYDVILLSGAVSDVPAELFAQLSGRGRLLAIIRADANAPGVATLFRKEGDIIVRRALFDAGCPMLPGFQAAAAFVF